MTVGVLGTGRMGMALARALAAAGETVLLCSARLGWPPPDITEPGCVAVSLGELLRHGELVLLAVPFPVAVGFVSGPAGRFGAGRTLVDATNPGQNSWRGAVRGANPPASLPPGISGGELIAEAAPTWQVAKAFNTVPADQVAACRLAGAAVTVPVAGAPAAKADVSALARRLGFEPLDAGGIEASRHLESLATLLIAVSAAHHLHGRVGIHIGQPDPPVGAQAARNPATPTAAPAATGRHL
ncbi:NADPH-dependent F420 reductase [Rugosimonospora acidiphila]|uniref:NADPH-dependent F420 reductase n=2 Tax=Rugosimonospora acidiphila TaxID=556531 RepID=A0ABP9RKF5_9ACTN